MTNYYINGAQFLVAVDCIIFGFDNEGLKLLLLKRGFEPCKGKWSLMGGFLNENESLNESATRVLSSLTGLDNLYMEQVYSFGEHDRDPGARVISVAYYALINIDDYDEMLGKEHNAHWVNIENAPELIFDHSIMVQKALMRLRRKASSQPIGFNLLPEKFTLKQLQSLYEAIFYNKLDKRNFRKKVLAMKVLNKHDEKDKLNSKRGAYLFSFNREAYTEMSNEGFTFGI